MNLYVIRHGQTEWNYKEIMLSREDIPLNETGIKQAEEASKIVDNLDYDLVISSPLSRTLQTAKIVNKNNNREIITDERLIERAAGGLSGKSTKDEIFRNYWEYERKIEEKGVEQIKDLIKRVHVFLDEIKEKYEGKNILIVTHNGVCRTIRTYFEGIPKNKDLRSLGQDNCEIKIYKM